MLSQAAPCSTQRSMRAPLKPQGSLAARWMSSCPMCSRSFSGMSSLVHLNAQSESLASLRLRAIRSTTSFRIASSIGSKKRSSFAGHRSLEKSEPAEEKQGVSTFKLYKKNTSNRISTDLEGNAHLSLKDHSCCHYWTLIQCCCRVCWNQPVFGPVSPKTVFGDCCPLGTEVYFQPLWMQRLQACLSSL